MATIVIGAQWGDEVSPFLFFPSQISFSQPCLRVRRTRRDYPKTLFNDCRTLTSVAGERQARRYSLPYRETLRQSPRRKQCRTHYSREWGYLRLPPSAVWINQSRVPKRYRVWSSGGLFFRPGRGGFATGHYVLRGIISLGSCWCARSGADLNGTDPCTFLLQGIERSGSQGSSSIQSI